MVPAVVVRLLARAILRKTIYGFGEILTPLDLFGETKGLSLVDKPSWSSELNPIRGPSPPRWPNPIDFGGVQAIFGFAPCPAISYCRVCAGSVILTAETIQ